MICIKRYYYAESGGKTLMVCANDFGLGPMPLVWCNGGIYGIICKEKVENMYETLGDQEKLPKVDVNRQIGAFHWDDVTLIKQKIGRLL